jgi:hypothetical protein
VKRCQRPVLQAARRGELQKLRQKNKKAAFLGAAFCEVPC